MPSDPASHKLKLGVTAVGLASLLAVLGLFSFGLRQLTRVSARVDANQQINTAALCALRTDLRQRVQHDERLLQKHPDGLLAATVRANVNSQQHTIAALARILCTEP